MLACVWAQTAASGLCSVGKRHNPFCPSAAKDGWDGQKSGLKAGVRALTGGLRQLSVGGLDVCPVEFVAQNKTANHFSTSAGALRSATHKTQSKYSLSGASPCPIYLLF